MCVCVCSSELQRVPDVNITTSTGRSYGHVDSSIAVEVSPIGGSVATTVLVT